MNDTQLTHTNSVMGSVQFLPPEQASGKGSTLKSDIYSMGILMYELLTGTLPYRGENAVEIALKHLKEPLPSIREELPDIPQAVENVILKSAAKNPKNRYNDARAMYEDLKTCLDESRKDEERFEYQYPELDSDGKKFTKQVEKAEKRLDSDEEEVVDETDDVTVKQITVDEVKKENRILIGLASLFVALLLIVVVIMFFLKNEILGNKSVAVPDVSGLSVKEAVQKLQDAGFVISDEQKDASSDTVAKGAVVSTKPAAGTKKSKGSEIVLYISVGSVTIEIEDYTGKDYREVKGALEAKGLNVLINKKEVDKDKKLDENQIIEQDIEVGKKVSEGTTITLYIPDIVTEYPDFTDGWSVDDVQKFCDEYNVKLVIKIVNDYDEGVIGKQSRPEGYTIVGGTSLTIYVGGHVEEEEDTECNSMEEECPGSNNIDSGDETTTESGE